MNFKLFIEKHRPPIIVSITFIVFGLANILTFRRIDIVGLLCVFAPLGFLNLIYLYGQSSTLYLASLAFSGLVLGKIMQILWNWKKWSILIIISLLAANAYGFFWWFMSQLDW